MENIAYWIVHFWFQRNTWKWYVVEEVKAIVETVSSKTVTDIIDKVKEEYWIDRVYFTKIESIPITSVIRLK